MSSGEPVEPLRFADDDDPDDLGGFSRGKRSYDDDEDEDGGWAINEDHSDRLWDSAEDADDDEEVDSDATVVSEGDEGEDEEEEEDLFGGGAPRGRRGRPKGSGKRQESTLTGGGLGSPGTGSGGAGSSSTGSSPPSCSFQNSRWLAPSAPASISSCQAAWASDGRCPHRCPRTAPCRTASARRGRWPAPDWRRPPGPSARSPGP